ncbi:MAG: 50S ribosomal protein L22 [candidate division Zixibacteria bacterium]|nr:50S ribosomal protein L22 [candidate division Zixibacteria bacterium]
MIVRSTAKLKYVSIPPRKMRLVGDMVKGLPVEKALNVLNFTPRIAARHIAKTVKSAAANALSIQGTDHLKPEDLVVKNVIVDSAPTAKRLRFQSMGRVFRIRKRFCHLTIHLEGEADITAQPAAKSAKAGKPAEAEKGAAAVKKTKRVGAKKTAKARRKKFKAPAVKAKTTAAKRTTTKAVKKGNK